MSDVKKCTLEDPEWNQCCCNCAHHQPVHFHCTTKPKPHPSTHSGRCVCKVQKGWACVNPETHPRVYDNWPEHSVGCECYHAMTAEEKRKASE